MCQQPDRIGQSYSGAAGNGELLQPGVETGVHGMAQQCVFQGLLSGLLGIYLPQQTFWIGGVVILRGIVL